MTGCAIGGVFQSPSADEMLNVTKATIKAAVCFIFMEIITVDIFNFTMAAEMADMEDDIEVRSIIAGEDAASES